MKTNCFQKYLGGALVFLLCAAPQLHAQFGGGGRGGGGGGGGRGGFGGGGFGGGGFGGGGGAANGSQQFNNNGTVGTASITVDPNTHNLVIVADKDTLAQIKQVIASLDAAQRQVLIKVAFVEVDDNNALNLGVEGNYTGFSKNFSTITGYITNYSVVNNAVVPSSISPISQSVTATHDFGLPQTPSGATGNGGIYTIMGNDFNATLQAIATSGKAQILSRPSILARDGQMAEVFVGQSIYLPSGVTYTSVGGTGATVPSINGTYTPVGIQLDVTPFIGENHLVQMILQPAIKSIDTSTPGQIIAYGSSSLAVTAPPIYAPNINTRSANTVVITPDGEPVVIGGLIGNLKSTSVSKIPLLGDLPVIGNLFKFSSHASQKNELLIFLTPRIVQMPEQLAAMSAHETAQAPLITNSIPQMELERFLDRLPLKK